MAPEHYTVTRDDNAAAVSVHRAHDAIQELAVRDAAEREARIERLARWTGDRDLARAQEAAAADDTAH